MTSSADSIDADTVDASDVSFLKYLEMVEDQERNDTAKRIRLGQRYFNLLGVVKPSLAHTVLGTENDPFYDDENIGKFLMYLYDRWPAEEEKEQT